MNWWEILALFAICAFFAWVYLHIIADIICPPDLARRARAHRDRRRPAITARRVYDQDDE
jgi:hypothetical protein